TAGPASSNTVPLQVFRSADTRKLTFSVPKRQRDRQRQGTRDGMTGTNGARRVGFVLIDGYALMSTAAAVEPLRAANLLAGRTLYEVRFLSIDGGPARSSAGSFFPAAAIAEAGADFDIVF